MTKITDIVPKNIVSINGFIDTVILGDSVEVMNSMPAKSVDMLFADPPYFQQLENELLRPNQTVVNGAGDDWDKFSGLSHYEQFTKEWLIAAKRVLKDNGTIWVMGSYTNIFLVGAIMQNSDWWILNQVIWTKNNPVPNMKGTRFCNSVENLIWAVKSKSSSGYTFNYREIKAGNDDLQMRADWYGPICTGGERLLTVEGEKAHSTQKPEWLLHRVITSSTKVGDVILDPFCGSGTTAAVAKKLGRHYITIDREQKYVSAAEGRLTRIEIMQGVDDKTALIGAPKMKVPFGTLIESGYVKSGLSLWLMSSPKKFTGKIATVMADGTIQCDGLRGSIHKVAKELLGLPACNGWTHWCLPPASSEGLVDMHLLDTLRDLYIARGGVSPDN